MTACQCIPTVTCAKNYDGITNRRKCQEVGLVLGDEYTLHSELQATEAVGIQSHIGACRAGHGPYCWIKHTEANARWLFQKAITGGKLADTTFTVIHSVSGQCQIEQLGQHAAMGFDEFAVHARQVYLPQVNARARMLDQPRHNCQ